MKADAIACLSFFCLEVSYVPELQALLLISGLGIVQTPLFISIRIYKIYWISSGVFVCNLDLFK